MIRKIEVEDYEVLREYYLTFANNVELSLTDPFRHIYVYVDDNDVIGFIDYSIIYERAELNYIFVKEEKRGLHLSYKLMDYFMIDVIKNKCDNITLEVSRSNLVAQQLYYKYNFKMAATRINYYNSEDAILLIREMNSNE